MSRVKFSDLIPLPQLTGEAMLGIAEEIAREKKAWRAKMSVPDGIVIPERPIPEDDEALLDEYRTAAKEMSALLKIRTSAKCPDGQEGAALDTWYIRVMNWRFRLQVALRDRIKGK